MNKQHTPGPWNTDETKSFYILHNGDFVANASTLSNARLISAAPDMFEALQCVVDLLGDQEGIFIDQCKVALAKAKGEA